MGTYVKEFGRSWDVRTPRDSIHWVSQNWHVSMTADEISKEIIRRTKAKNGFTPEIIQECIAYALIIHEKRLKLYRMCTR